MRIVLSFAALAAMVPLLAANGKGESEFSPEAYRNPPPESSPAFFWMWNCRLDLELLCGQLDEMASNGVRNVCIHPFPKSFRPKSFHSEMSPDYMTDEYLDVYAKVVAHAKKLGMHSWLYDEGGWPSGGACVLVAASDGEGRFRARGIGRGLGNDRPFGVHVQDYESGGMYPSMIEPGATERFIELTHERLRGKVGGEFGGTIKFAFTDEPDIHHWYWFPMLPWCSDFADEFRRIKGYDIMPHMQEVLDARYETTGAAVDRRIDFMEVLGDLFVERYLLPLRDWCRRNGLKSGGHFSGEDDPENGAQRGFGSLLKSLRALDVPGVDMIWRQTWPATATDPGRQPPFPRYAASAARQNGGRHALCEMFAICGDSLTPLEMQWLCNYQMVRGINLLVLAYQAVSNAGQWMTLLEPHLGPVSPLWEFSGPFWKRLHRMCGMLARGRSASEIAVFYDQRSFWRGGSAAKTAASLHYAASAALDAMNCDFDFVDCDILAGACVTGGVVRCGAAEYSTLVVPSMAGVRDDARATLERFRAAGGAVLSLSDIGRAPRTCRVSGCRAEEIRVSKRVSGNSAMYLVVNESVYPSEVLEIEFPEKGLISHVNHETGLYEKVKSDNGRFTWKFDAAGAEMFVTGTEPEAEAAPPRTSAATYARKITDGWTVKPLRRHSAGRADFVVNETDAAPAPAALGDWGSVLGHDFSGTALYANEFDSEGGEAALDLGRVNHACSVRLNGELLPERFAGPFRWDVRLRKGRNVIEVKVANTLANAIADGRVRDRIAHDFPPRSPYDARQAEFDRRSQPSGLFGPVTLEGK